MLKENRRVCDVCGDDIPKGTKYRVARLRPEDASALLDVSDIGLIPSWTQEPDGIVRLDICLDCHMSMGRSFESKEVH